MRERRSIAFWGLLLPAAALLLAWPTQGRSLLLLLGLPVLSARIYLRCALAGAARRDARLLALFHVLAKFPQAVGLVQFLALRLLRRRRRVVDWREAS